MPSFTAPKPAPTNSKPQSFTFPSISRSLHHPRLPTYLPTVPHIPYLIRDYRPQRPGPTPRPRPSCIPSASSALPPAIRTDAALLSLALPSLPTLPYLTWPDYLTPTNTCPSVRTHLSGLVIKLPSNRATRHRRPCIPPMLGDPTCFSNRYRPTRASAGSPRGNRARPGPQLRSRSQLPLHSRRQRSPHPAERSDTL